MTAHDHGCTCGGCQMAAAFSPDFYVAVALILIVMLGMLATTDYAQRVFWALVIQWGS